MACLRVHSSSLILLARTSTRPALLAWSYLTSARPALLFAADSYYWRSPDGEVETELFRLSWRAGRACETDPLDGRYPIAALRVGAGQAEHAVRCLAGARHRLPDTGYGD